VNIDDFEIGMSFDYRRSVGKKDVVAFAEVSGDKNPIHLDARYAEKTRFGRCIVHGMLTASFISKVFGTDFPGPGCIYLSQTLKFLKPVFVGDIVTTSVRIISIDRVRSRLVFETTCSVLDTLVVNGEAEIFIPKEANFDSLP
jgi:3-hydroxybutyryl-CoA dehydratase